MISCVQKEAEAHHCKPAVVVKCIGFVTAGVAARQHPHNQLALRVYQGRP